MDGPGGVEEADAREVSIDPIAAGSVARVEGVSVARVREAHVCRAEGVGARVWEGRAGARAAGSGALSLLRDSSVLVGAIRQWAFCAAALECAPVSSIISACAWTEGQVGVR